MLLVEFGTFHVIFNEFFFTCSACEVSFDNVPVPLENVIGEIGGGFKVSSILSPTQTIFHDCICEIINFRFVSGRLL